MVEIEDPNAEKRNHGYCVGQLKVDNGIGVCKIWPRSIHRINKKDHYVFIADPDIEYSDDDKSLQLGEHYIPKAEKKSVDIAKIQKGSLKERQHYVNSKRKIVLENDDELRLNSIEKHVKKLWQKHDGPNWQILHNEEHNLNVEISLYSLIPDNKLDCFTPSEWFCLLCAVWLHEIGMIVGLVKNDDKLDSLTREQFYLKVRDNHHSRAVEYLKQNYNKTLDLTEDEYNLISFICVRHRIHHALTEHQSKKIILSAYLKLSLLIHLDVEIQNNILFELIHDPGISWESKFHWLKLKWIRSIIPDHDRSIISVTVCEPPPNSSLHGFLPEKIYQDMRSGLSSLKEILIRAKISFFNDIKEDFGGSLDQQIINEMELIQDNIELEEISSASEAYQTILSTFKKYSEMGHKVENLIDIYLRNIEQIYQQIRPCHTLIGNLIEKMSKILQDEKKSNEEKIDEIKNLIYEQQRKRELILKSISEISQAFLKDKNSILLYGYSTMVIAALEGAPETIKKDTPVYIAECRGKTQFNSNNIMTHNDGLTYLQRVVEIGYKNIIFINDISIGNYMKRNKISKVFFGANGIDKKTGSFGHTCGHSTIADLASIYKVPVYVIASKSKLGNLKWKENLERKIEWLPKNEEISWITDEVDLTDVTVKLGNPREDMVDPDKVYMIITEEGPLPPYRISLDLVDN